MHISVDQTIGFGRLLSGCVALVLGLLGLVVGSPVQAQEGPGPMTQVTTPTDDRVLGLLDVGNNMLVDGRNAQAYSHFQNFALQFPGNGPLMQAWAQSARAADRLENLSDLAASWDGLNGRPSREMAIFIRAYLALFEVDTGQSDDVVDAALADVRTLILETDLRIEESSNLQLLLSMIALRDLGEPTASIAEAQNWIEKAKELDPRDPTIIQLADVIGYLTTAQALVDQGQGLSVQAVANAGLEIGAIQSSRLPGAIRERSAALMQALVIRQSRDEAMPREYLRGLTNIIALADLGEEGAYTAATTWYAAGDLPAFQQSVGFQGYGNFLGRFLSCYADPTAGLNLLSRLEAIQYEQSRDLNGPIERAIAERRLETLVLLWRFSTRMRLGDEAREFRDEARALSEALANRTRANVVSGPWVLPLIIVAVFVLAVSLVSLLWYFVRARPTQLALQHSKIARQTPAVITLIQRVGATYARWTFRHCLTVISYTAGIALWFVLLGFGLLAVASQFFPGVYQQLYSFTDTRMLGAVTISSVLFIGALVGMLAVGRQPLDPGRLVSSIDQHLALGGVA